MNGKRHAKKGLYARLAADNIRKNAQLYIPYLITCCLTAAMLYIITSLSRNSGLIGMQGDYALLEILRVGSIITRIFAFIFLFYTNSFISKKRKKEFGLLNILGMEKRHIARVLFMETLYSAVISLAIGFGAGILLDKLLFMLLRKMLGGSVRLGFYISRYSLIVTAIFMLITFLLIFLNSLRQIHFAQPVELMRGSQVGEKEPKAKWLMALLGVVLLGIGYYISIVTKSPLKAIELFFIAVLCVILGTYLLFTSGSIAVLKIMKSKKSYYYKTKNFTTVSGLMYRMKQNAVGMANICILSTMVLVMVSTTTCLMAGMEDIIKTRYPYDFMVSYGTSKSIDIEKVLKENGVNVTKSQSYTSLEFGAFCKGGRVYAETSAHSSASIDDVYELEVLSAEEYGKLVGEDVSLDSGEILFYSSEKNLDFDSLDLCGKDVTVKERLKSFPNEKTYNITQKMGVVVSGDDEVQRLNEYQQGVYGENASFIQNIYNFDVEGGGDESVKHLLEVCLAGSGRYMMINAKYSAHDSFISLYGGLFFLGTFLGILFVMETVLIIYYKQISEGYDDKKRFEIMQNVGMSRAEVKRSIHSQIVKVFFLPLLTAGLHTAFSFPLIRRLMLMMNMTNAPLFALCLLACFAAFAVLYTIIYSVTARTYYRIVSK